MHSLLKCKQIIEILHEYVAVHCLELTQSISPGHIKRFTINLKLHAPLYVQHINGQKIIQNEL